MPIIRFTLDRLAVSLLSLVIVSAIIFGITVILPGDVATRILGRVPSPDQLAILRTQLGLDQPLPLRYFSWITGFATGDLGTSLISGQPVSDIITRRLGNTALLAGLSLTIYFPLAVLPAIVQAVHRDDPLDHAISAITLGLLSLPDFLLATILLIVFAVWIPIAPARSTIDSFSTVAETLGALILPAMTVALVMGTYAIRYLRDSLIEVLDTEYIRMARLNGIGEARILWRHALPNALIPTINITSLNVTYLFGGVVIVEQVFVFPGFSGLLVDSLMLLDTPVIQATVLIAAAVYIVGNFVSDILSMLLNPRLREV